MDGILVVKPVELVLRDVPEAARNHLRDMAENPARDHRSKDSCATGNPALVRLNRAWCVVEEIEDKRR